MMRLERLSEMLCLFQQALNVDMEMLLVIVFFEISTQTPHFKGTGVREIIAI